MAGHPAELLTVQELASHLKVPVNTVYYWLSRHPRLPRHKLGRHLRFNLPDVLNYWDQQNGRSSRC